MSFANLVRFLAVFLRGIDAAIFILCALLFVWDWVRRRCYLPAYIHVFAAFTFVGSWVLLRWMTYCYPPEPPPSKWVDAGAALFLALIVYVVFVLYGGADAAWEAKQEHAQKAIQNASLSKEELHQNARDAARNRYMERLHLGGRMVLLFALAFVNAVLVGFLFYGFLPLWGALLVGTLFCTGAVALFLVSQTYSPTELTYKHLALFVVLLALLYEK